MNTTPVSSKKMRALIYSRISKEMVRDAKAQGIDLSNTHRLTEEMLAVAAAKGFDVDPVLDVYEDEDISASKYSGYKRKDGTRVQKRRPGYERFIQRLEEKQTDAILCVEISRLTRRGDEMEAFWNLVPTNTWSGTGTNRDAWPGIGFPITAQTGLDDVDAAVVAMNTTVSQNEDNCAGATPQFEATIP
jgi:Resolvase, N terminal domain